MALYLMRHGEAVLKEMNADRPLSDRGEREVRRTAAMAAGKNITVARIFHSGKKRAMQTAMIAREYLQPPPGMAETAGIAPKDDIANVLPLIEKEDDIMIVGHLPFLEKLAAYLVTGNQDKRIVELPTGGIVRLDRGKRKGVWKVAWKLAP